MFLKIKIVHSPHFCFVFVCLFLQPQKHFPANTTSAVELLCLNSVEILNTSTCWILHRIDRTP